ncbi:hypothetical protein A2867_00205 [Candidatus Daviesbacteria bacterium RIFCSPHIGHO2_01_FULL_40_11]|uniref:Type II secretion system protein GspG C-terminal domain-containing protein n=1 Tax=Candidatus Daviesbacteria bacterium RIFCSPHIGHO2_01_FULL_40_11 TaxID=1797762 RepID=A0A1F5JLU5_9BACT|nr:MAG: hypothetical protein A2867_00205 [Candidatus Daviesbacteria bacterium RIFCSPHIGHO2_01_FULL_40_11]
MKLMSRCRSGFTLIELLITISIIAVLSLIGLVIYSSVLKQGRDSKRQSDLRSIQSALEQYFADQFDYPSAITFNGGALSAGGRTYLNTIPSDPQSSPNYCYLALPNNPCDNSSTNKCTSYKLYAKLESQPNGSYSCGSVSTYNLEFTPP